MEIGNVRLGVSYSSRKEGGGGISASLFDAFISDSPGHICSPAHSSYRLYTAVATGLELLVPLPNRAGSVSHMRKRYTAW